ncbi:MFS transporter, partial [Salmonella enterica]|uniref:MFS transporter n=1 Tax=Salmonella enterica TaxID=28901 RepID=UPI00329834EA
LYSMVGWRGMFVIGAVPVGLLPNIWFKVPESPVWLAARARKENTALPPVLRKQWMLSLYLLLVMGFFNFFSHGTQDLYP